MANNLADDDGGLRRKLLVSDCVVFSGRGTNHWCTIRASDSILRESEPYGGRSADENSIRNLMKTLNNVSLKEVAVHVR